MNKKQLQSEQTKKKVASAARALFAQKGYKGTSIEDIVEATESSKGNIYYHFKSKEGLFLYLLEEWDLEWEQKWNEQQALYETSTEKLYAIVEQSVMDDFSHPLTKAADEFFNHEEKTNEVEKRMTVMIDRHLEFNKRLIQEGIDRGELEPMQVEHLAIILESLFFGLNQLSRRSYAMDEVLTIYRTAIKVVLHGIAISTLQQT
ncbi:TetR family transcriptional regulator [Paenibacillus sp. BIHB 4019]|uniref:TetR family transcriptional regulator n=1 Tax=Paenibacillus sp. BIHB 4019 TaxID=1870819 RepID=A0A1B2DEX3_9BACL|nr:TetR/AcrR family transcriptional regulator [Paenibacillus sp. BIHB 4019]ANY66246.1 TetR family transcriptional regulator [Paenibacillus sp. BIHB 4019]